MRIVVSGVRLLGSKSCRCYLLLRTLGESHLFIHRDFFCTVSMGQVLLEMPETQPGFKRIKTLVYVELRSPTFVDEDRLYLGGLP